MSPPDPNPNPGGKRRPCCFFISGDPQGADQAQRLRESLELALSFALLDQPLDLMLTGAAATLPQAATTPGISPEIIELWEFLRDSATVCIYLHDLRRGAAAPYPQLSDRDLARMLSRGGPGFYL